MLVLQLVCAIYDVARLALAAASADAQSTWLAASLPPVNV